MTNQFSIQWISIASFWWMRNHFLHAQIQSPIICSGSAGKFTIFFTIAIVHYTDGFCNLSDTTLPSSEYFFTNGLGLIYAKKATEISLR